MRSQLHSLCSCSDKTNFLIAPHPGHAQTTPTVWGIGLTSLAFYRTNITATNLLGSAWRVVDSQVMSLSAGGAFCNKSAENLNFKTN
jgi:hypothetical protein